MQIVFMNRLVKDAGSEGEKLAQVWIGEEEGTWHLGWRDLEMTGEAMDTAWYEGGSWNEMLYIYRHGLAVKLGEGFRPLIDGTFHEEEELKGRSHAVQKLYCYSELHNNEELYAELTSWRRRKAASERKAPYFIASNRVLRLISAFVPHTIEELLQLPGVGESKASEYGADLIEIAGTVQRSHEFPLDWVNDALDDQSYLSWTYKQKEHKYKQDLDKYRTRRTMLKGIYEGMNLQQLEQECGLPRRDLVEALEQLEKEGYDTERLIQSELEEVPQEEQERVWAALEELGDALLKPVLLQVYGEDAGSGSGMEQRYERIRLIRIRFRRQPGSRRSVG